jgi:hypothetical protein
MALLLVYAAATVVMAATTVTMPEHRPLAPAMFLIGLIGTWRQFLRWRGQGD